MTCKHGEPGCVCTQCDMETIAAAQSKSIAELREAAKAMRDWIDAVPIDIRLPAMPGFDRDWVDSLLDV